MYWRQKGAAGLSGGNVRLDRLRLIGMSEFDILFGGKVAASLKFQSSDVSLTLRIVIVMMKSYIQSYWR